MLLKTNALARQSIYVRRLNLGAAITDVREAQGNSTEADAIRRRYQRGAG